MHHFEPNLDDDQCSLDRIKTDEQDAFRIAIYCEQNHKNVLDKSPRIAQLLSDLFIILQQETFIVISGHDLELHIWI